MQHRHSDRYLYFKELAITSEKYLRPYIMQRHDVCKDMAVLEIGCGEGGNLVPFAKYGCNVVGIDISKNRITEAKLFFGYENISGTFLCDDILQIKGFDNRFDIIICHDVIEHISDKQALLEKAHTFLKDNGILFIAFPAWQMPFGGHQQICHNSFLSKLPFFHLIPRKMYKRILAKAGETKEMISELLSIRQTGITIEQFEMAVSESKWNIIDRTLYLINPHYETKYGLKPRRLPMVISKVPYLRNFISTSCFYLLTSRMYK